MLTIAAVCLSGLFIFTPECIQAGDFTVRTPSVDLEIGDVKLANFMCLNGVMDLVSGNIPCLQERSWPWHMTDYGHGPGMMGCWFGGFLMWIIVIVIIAVVVYLIIRDKKPRGEDALMSETPLDILKKRYAKGEISREEFDEIRKHIEK